MAERNDRSARRDGRDESRKRSDEGHPTRDSTGDAVEPDVENSSWDIRYDYVVPTVVGYQRRKLFIVIKHTK